mmetsp:Transcript_6759/g.13936  ORF Transcript_6759/g.13936 Transcript_6759/m.13936 type:complete len:244 (+) Transcript_6759:127-858(+)
MSTTTSSTKIPAWKLRRQLIQQKAEVPTALRVNTNDELGGNRSVSSRSSRGSFQKPARTFSDTGSIASAGSTRSTTSMSSFSSNYSQRSRSSQPSCHVRRTIRPVSRVPDGLDPSVPPAFRAALKLQQQQREKKNSHVLASSVASHSRTDACSTTGQSYDSDLSSLDSDDDKDFDDEDSFASVDSKADEEDDDAYQMSRNQMAQFRIENMPTLSPLLRDRRPKSRFQKKTRGVHGTPLGLIAE